MSMRVLFRKAVNGTGTGGTEPVGTEFRSNRRTGGTGEPVEPEPVGTASVQLILRVKLHAAHACAIGFDAKRRHQGAITRGVHPHEYAQLMWVVGWSSYTGPAVVCRGIGTLKSDQNQTTQPQPPLPERPLPLVAVEAVWGGSDEPHAKIFDS